MSWVVAAAPPSRVPEQAGREASAPSRTMDESGELGGLETMETLTELGDELTLGDIDGEWWVGDWGAGARGEEGVTAARAGALAPPARSTCSRGKGRRTRPPRGVPGFPGAAGLNPRPAAPFRQAVGSAPGVARPFAERGS